MTKSDRPGRAPGVTLVLGGLALGSVGMIELAGGNRGDGDNPAESLRYLAESGDLYAYSGLALVVGAVMLVASAIGSYRALGSTSLPFTTATVFALIAGGALFTGGALRMQSVGTVPYIASMDQSWGEAAYLAVQLAGTQGLMSAGIIALAAWLVSLGVVFARRGIWAPVAFAVFPAITLLILALDLAFPTLDELNIEGLFVVYVASSIVGVPLCCVAFGVTLIARKQVSSTP